MEKDPNSKNKFAESELGWGRYCWFKISSFPENFMTTRKMKQISVLAKNLYALEVQDACKALKSKAKVRDLVVESDSKLPLNMQSKKKFQTIVEEPQLEMLRGDWVEASTHRDTSSRGNFEPSQQRDHMQPYLQVWGGAMWSDSPKKAEIGQGPLRGFISWIVPCYKNPKYIVVRGISGIDAFKDQSDRG